MAYQLGHIFTLHTSECRPAVRFDTKRGGQCELQWRETQQKYESCLSLIDSNEISLAQ